MTKKEKKRKQTPAEKKEIELVDSGKALEDVDELLEKFDKESSKLRKMGKPYSLIVAVIAISMSLFHLYTGGFGTLLAVKQRSLHLIFTMVLGFMLYPAFGKSEKSRPSIMDFILIILAIVVFGYLFMNVEAIVLKGGKLTKVDFYFGLIAILLTLELTRRVVGPELPLVAIIFLLYAYFGRSVPGILSHRGFSLNRIISHMYFTTEGILGIPLGVSATFVFMFILFGSFLDKTGVGKFFIDIAYALTGGMKSGPAMTSVVSSGLMGSISGSSVANTVTTGAFTIPLMKRTGYEPHFAGAVEATASTGGQIMPPVMGAAAFIMADFTGIPYIHIVLAALIPALLYYVAVGVMVHLEASKLGLKGIPKDQLPSVPNILLESGYLMVPLMVVVYMLVKQYTPTRSAFVAILVAILVAYIAALIKKDKSFNYKSVLSALENGAKGALGVACACACAGMIVGVVTLTGFGLRVAEIIVTVARGNLMATLFLTMIASLILGMGLPTTAKYIVLATMAVPALTKLGVNLMAAHLFILYFGVVADVTPPVALAAYAGAGIAGSNSMKTGVQAFKLALAGFTVPFIFAIDSHLILVESVVGTTVTFIPFYQALPTIATAILGIFCLATAVAGYMLTTSKFYERIILFVSALMLLKPGYLTDGLGLGVLIIIYLVQKTRQKRETLAGL
ncbi:MAG TPA: TRAP transporter permease [Clostridia bacterium]|nr:TRAP transporter permease [Clostridia bacterium]